MRYAWLIALASCATGEKVGTGLVTGIEDFKRGSVHIRDQAAYDAFRRDHERVVGRDKRDMHGEPLPDFDFTNRDLVIVWTGSMYRTLEIVSIGSEITARETLPSYDENAVARMVNVGCYEMISIPKSDKPIGVRWMD